jgi:hypothetical protein
MTGFEMTADRRMQGCAAPCSDECPFRYGILPGDEDGEGENIGAETT